MKTLKAFGELASLSLAAVKKTPFEATITAARMEYSGVVIEGVCPMCKGAIYVSSHTQTLCRCKRRWSVHLIGTPEPQP